MATDMINSLKIGSDVHVLSLPYGACATGADVTAKTVSVDNFSLETGAHVSIKFNNANTATSPTLNVNSTGAKTIYYRGADLNTASLAKQLQGIIEFVYNGTQWEVVGNLDTDTNTKSFTITANASDDDVVVLSGTNGSNAVTYSASHAKKGPSSGYTSGNTTTSISGSGGSGTIKIPQITVDSYGHVTAGADESVTITLPTIPALSETPSTDTSTIKPTGSAKSKTFTAITALGTNNHTITDTTTTYTLDLSEFATTAEISTAMVFKGSLGTNGTITSLPTAAAALVGDTYKVITAGTYANIAAKVGDVFVCSSKPEWVLIPSGDEPSGTVTSIATSGDITGGTITTSGTISHKTSGVTAGSYGPSANATPAAGGTFSVPYLTVNANGHVTAASTKTITIPNHNAFSNVKVGNTTIAADTTTDTLTLVGSNVTLTPDATNDKVTIGITKANVTAALGYTPPSADTNTTYTFTTGDANGQIKVTPNSGDAYNIDVKGLGSAAYTASTAYATAAQGTKADNAFPKTGGSISGAVTLTGTAATTAHLKFSREGYNYITFPSSGHLAFGTSATGADIIVDISPSAFSPYSTADKINLGASDKKWDKVYAVAYYGSGANLTSLNASNIDTGILPSDRLPVVPIAKGGTGATDAANALINLGITTQTSDPGAGSALTKGKIIFVYS